MFPLFSRTDSRVKNNGKTSSILLHHLQETCTSLPFHFITLTDIRRSRIKYKFHFIQDHDMSLSFGWWHDGCSIRTLSWLPCRTFHSYSMAAQLNCSYLHKSLTTATALKQFSILSHTFFSFFSKWKWIIFPANTDWHSSWICFRSKCSFPIFHIHIFFCSFMCANG